MNDTELALAFWFIVFIGLILEELIHGAKKQHNGGDREKWESIA